MLLQAKAWYLSGEKAFLEHAFKQMRRGVGKAAKGGEAACARARGSRLAGGEGEE